MKTTLSGRLWGTFWFFSALGLNRFSDSYWEKSVPICIVFRLWAATCLVLAIVYLLDNAKVKNN